MFDLHGKRAHALVVGSWNVQTPGRKVELIFRHGFGSFHNLLFDAADLAVHGGSYGCRTLRLLRLGRTRACVAVRALSQGGDDKDEHGWYQQDSWLFHLGGPFSVA